MASGAAGPRGHRVRPQAVCTPHSGPDVLTDTGGDSKIFTSLELNSENRHPLVTCVWMSP